MRHFQFSLTFKTSVLSLATILATNPAIAANLTVAPNGGNTQINQSGNGVPVININTPNANGLSHNKYTDYNVGKQGVILNNSANNTNTQLGGKIGNNPNLKPNQAANVILNEVTSGNASLLQGYTEVAGKQAHVIVANPNGVTCNGCGFINTSRVTVTTGNPVIENGQISRYDVNQGNVTIEGEGLDARNISRFDILSRTANINAKIYAKEINIVTGRNDITDENLTIYVKPEDKLIEKPQLAIDSSALGGMYAGTIRLISTEGGVGVNLDGNMASNADNIRLHASGKLTIGGTIDANKNLAVNANTLVLNNTVYAGDSIDLSFNQATINKSIASNNDLIISGNTLTNNGTIVAGTTKDGRGSNNKAKLIIKGNSLNNQGKTITSRGSAEIAVNTLSNGKGQITSATSTLIRANSLYNQEGKIISETGPIDINLNNLYNQQGNILGKQSLSIRGNTMNNQNGKITSETGAIDINFNNLYNQQGNILGKQSLSIRGNTLNNQNGKLTSEKGVINLKFNNLYNQQGNIVAQEGITISSNSIDNSEKGRIYTKAGNIDLSGLTLNNQRGEIYSDNGKVNQHFLRVNNEQGLIGKK